MKFRKTLIGLLAGATILTSAGIAQAAEITLKVSHYLPPSHGFQKDFLENWGKELSEKTNGKVEVKVFDATSAFGKIDRQADQVRAGVMDMAVGLNGIPRDRYPAASVIEMPFLVKYADSGSETLSQLYKEGLLGSDYNDFKVLGLFTHEGGLIHTLDTPVRSLEDLKGLRLRTPSPAVSAMLESFGASPVGLPPSAIYENLQKGNIACPKMSVPQLTKFPAIRWLENSVIGGTNGKPLAKPMPKSMAMKSSKSTMRPAQNGRHLSSQ